LKKKQGLLLALLALAAAAVLWLTVRSRQPPLLPADATHDRWESAEACDACHGPSGPVPRSAKHPLGFDCLRCHGSR